MPSCTPDPPQTPPESRDAREGDNDSPVARIHAALDTAIVCVTNRGAAGPSPVHGVNISLLTDALRAAGVPVHSGRGERPAHYGRPAAAERAHGAAPFGTGSRVRPVAGAPTAVPLDSEGEVRQVFRHGTGKETSGAWLADVQWDGGGVSEGLNCEWLELAGPMPHFTEALREFKRQVEADRPRADAEFARQLYTDGPPSMSARLGRGEKRPAWWGEPPAEGTRRKLIGDVLRVEDVLSESEVREFADAIELALVEVDGRARDSERYRDDLGGDAIVRALNLLCGAREESGDRAEPRLNHAITAVHMVLEPPSDPAKEAELREPPQQYGNDALDKPGYPPGLRYSERRLWDRAEDATVLDVLSRLSRERTPRGRARLVGPLEGDFLRTLLRACLAMPNKLDDDEAETARRLLTTLEQTNPPWEVDREDVAATAQGLLTAAQKLPEEDYKLLERALRWDVEDVETARPIDAEGAGDPEESEGVAEDLGDAPDATALADAAATALLEKVENRDASDETLLELLRRD